MGVTRIFDLLDRYSHSYGDKVDTLASKKDGTWVKYSTKDYIELSRYVSCGLLELGFKKGDKIATISNNCPEWNILDMGMLQIGVIQVPVYPTISAEDHAYILNHSDAKLAIISDKILYNKLKLIIDTISAIENIYVINDIDGVDNWMDIVKLGKKNCDKYSNQLDDIKKNISENDLATIIYTSGTTGSPKGVMLSHQNLVTNFIATSKIQPMTSEHKALSFLPLCHVYERMVNYQFQYKGISIYYAENFAKIADNIKELKVDGFNTVPRLLEKVYDKIISKGNDLPLLSRMIFFWAVNLGLKFDTLGNSSWYKMRLSVARKLVFSKWHKALGGNLKIIVCGGSSLQIRLMRIFWAANIPIVEGYGLTETSPVVAVNHYDVNNLRFGTVGPVLENVKVMLSDDGEILCKGPNVMLGYYKDPDYTKEVINDDGWFHTGDIGRFEDDKYLRITDRKKEIFKTSAGKYIAPQAIENKFKESFLIEQVIVVGENEKFASALISPNFNHLHGWCTRKKIIYRDNKELVQNPAVVALYNKEVVKINKSLGQVEQISRFRLVCEEWTPQMGELSPTLKLKRKFIYRKYDAILKEIYSYAHDEKNRAIKE